MIYNKLSLLRIPVRNKYLQLAREVAKDEVFRELGLRLTAIETLRYQDRQDRLVKEGKSWTSKSMHLLGLAVDAALSKRKGTKVIQIIWDYLIGYRRMADLAIKVGFRNGGVSWGKDWVHCESPQIFQGGADCYVFVGANAIQKGSEDARRKKKEDWENTAEFIGNELGRRRMLKSVGSALELYKEYGFIKNYEKISPRDMYFDTFKNANRKKEIYILSQKTKVMGKDRAERWENHRRNIENGIGIYNHTALFEVTSGGNLILTNSHEEFPTYHIKWGNFVDVVRTVYKVSM